MVEQLMTIRKPDISIVYPWLSIIRVGNTIALGYAALVGYLLASGSINISVLLRAFIVAFMLGGSGNIMNDYFDAPVDAINKPWRPIPSGLIKPRTAVYISVLLGIIGVMISFTISAINGVIALTALILCYSYSWRLKRMLLVGNLVIAFLTGLSIIYGGLAKGTLTVDVIIASAYAFLLNLGREFIKGMEDIEGDKKYGIKTLASAFSMKVAYVSALIVYAWLIILSFVPYIVMQYSVYYLTLAVLGVDSVLITALAKASSLDPKDALKASRLIKIAVFCGITAFFVEALIRSILQK